MKHSLDTRQRDTPIEQDVQPKAGGDEDNEIDQILADSFPASDAPPWTLGVTTALPDEREEPQRRRR